MLKKDIDAVLAETVRVLREGGIILYPTDTVWGLGCDATDPAAVARIFALKHRAEAKSLVLLASDLDMVAKYIKEIPPMAIDLVEVNDAPMTLIYPGAIAGRKPAEGECATADSHRLAWNAVAEDGSVGIRIPMMDFCRRMAGKLGRPVVSTSANLSGEPSPRKYADIVPAIREAVDYTVDPRLEAGATGKASQIIRVGMDGEVEILRA